MVVPRLVEQSEAPAVNACNWLAFVSSRKENDKAIGKQMPVAATPIDRATFALTAVKDVEMPPMKREYDQFLGKE